ncbi:MAG TPA: 4Fe-4S dicluster domain-containing protein [Candidatus Hydrothermia bacterium]|nr:4Fe-4S dicluster domain-containing protein [Candidatus Hydrothermae bacterium]MDD3649409.1 4Fe-4S dicluster domain-containing protein [Candidatus Hydrothermia bacterium]MDD5573478.1 4Fe-4S dicluster domain-containing protein [Candidatus Hydrothermia bacterium]HOK22873.1 4Fe-4S dicluster domain-containing protein [Candidatus Hydrothermia bacterium]HOL23582.1 4Fe-4S dicluster domain-containing protein [Candidatus Hydrothermia bacterium]
MKKSFEIEVQKDWCKACYICVKACPKNVFDISEIESHRGFKEVIPARIEECIGCMMCENLCPDFAIEVKEKEHAVEEG